MLGEHLGQHRGHPGACTPDERGARLGLVGEAETIIAVGMLSSRRGPAVHRKLGGTTASNAADLGGRNAATVWRQVDGHAERRQDNVGGTAGRRSANPRLTTGAPAATTTAVIEDVDGVGLVAAGADDVDSRARHLDAAGVAQGRLGEALADLGGPLPPWRAGPTMNPASCAAASAPRTCSITHAVWLHPRSSRRSASPRRRPGQGGLCQPRDRGIECGGPAQHIRHRLLVAGGAGRAAAPAPRRPGTRVASHLVVPPAHRHDDRGQVLVVASAGGTGRCRRWAAPPRPGSRGRGRRRRQRTVRRRCCSSSPRSGPGRGRGAGCWPTALMMASWILLRWLKTSTVRVSARDGAARCRNRKRPSARSPEADPRPTPTSGFGTVTGPRYLLGPGRAWAG